MTTEKEIRKQLRLLRKLKRNTQVGTVERQQINKQIRDLKKQYETIEVQLKPNEHKQKLIDELTEYYRKSRRPILTDLRTYTTYQLEVHLNKIKGIYD